MNNVPISQRIKNSIVPSLLSGSIGGAAHYFMYRAVNDAVKVPFASFEVSPFMAVGGAIAVGTLSGEILTQFALPYFQGNAMYGGLEEIAIPPAMAGVGTVAAVKFLIGGDEMLNPFLLGAASSVGAKYITGAFEIESMLRDAEYSVATKA